MRLVSVPPSPRDKRDWPFLGTYLISSILCISLLILNFTTPPTPHNEYDYIHVLIASLRAFCFLSLAVISEIHRTRPISLPDTEANPQGSSKANGSTHYGTFDYVPSRHHFGRGGGGTNPPPKGGWITYVRSFQVCLRSRYKLM